MEILIGIFGMIYPPVNENIAMVCYGIDGPMVDDLPFFFYQVIFQFPTLNSVTNSFRQSRVAHKTENLVS